MSIIGPWKKQLKVCYFTKNSPSLKWTKQTETKLPSIQQFGQFVSFSLQMHALWTALTFKSWNALWDTILKIGDEPWPTTTLVPSMCFTHMTQGDLAAPFWKFVIQKECKSIKKYISINSYIGWVLIVESIGKSRQEKNLSEALFNSFTLPRSDLA